jgi:hypothetical protein
MSASSTHRWIKFLRSYGPIPRNDAMYDETIQRALKRLAIKPLKLPAPYLDELLANFSSENPVSEILTGTAGDGKTYRCREVWLDLGGDEKEWLGTSKVKTLTKAGRTLIFIKDLSELKKGEESVQLLRQMARDVADTTSSRRYLVAANHGQLIEKLRIAADDDPGKRLLSAVEDMLFGHGKTQHGLNLKLRDLSKAHATLMIKDVIKEITAHPGWEGCVNCASRASGKFCPIYENRNRLVGASDNEQLQTRLAYLLEISAQNGVHFPVRQLLILVSNALLGHPDAQDGLMTCEDVPAIVQSSREAKASVYRNLFGENLTPRRAEKTDVFRKLASFGIGGETSNAADNLLVYGADDPIHADAYKELVLTDQIYGGTPEFAQAQEAYLESYDPGAQQRFLALLRSQRQRFFFTLPESQVGSFKLWDLTVFRYAGLFLESFIQVQTGQPLDRRTMPLVMRGLNRLFSGLLVQNQDDLVLATSGSLSQSKRSPLLDEIISVPRQQGQEVSVVAVNNLHSKQIAVRVKVSRGDDPGPVELVLTPTRFEFLGRVAEGALPSSFSLECQEDLLAFKQKLLAATERRRKLDNDDEGSADELVLRFIDVSGEGNAAARRVVVRA